MKAKDEMMTTLRHLSLDRKAVIMMKEDISRIEEDIKKEPPAVQREALETERSRLMSSMKITKHHIERIERLLSLLSSEEQEVLECMIVDPYPEVVFDLSEKLGFEPCSVYRLRARALDKLTRLRYGAGTCA